MLPVDFKYRMMYLRKPKDMTDEQCSSLPVWSNGEEYVSCWRLNAEELKEVQETGTIYLHIAGSGHPPVCPSVECPVTGDFLIKDGLTASADYFNTTSGKWEPIFGEIVEENGTYLLISDSADAIAIVAFCRNVTLYNA